MMLAIRQPQAYTGVIESETNSPESGLCLLCGLVGVLAAVLALAVLAKALFFVPHGPTVLSMDASCSLSRETCALTLPDGGRIEFVLGPRPVPLLSPLKLEVHISGSSARPLEVDFSGVSFPMAFNRAFLTPSGKGIYSAQTSLPICTSGRMTWQATVLLESGARQMLAPFRFETER
ncbi:MAG: hypothetical protein K8H84_08240 [Sulfuricella denitrificans]|nr:hypothetical protein [Sulfuricella denitrificans]